VNNTPILLSLLPAKLKPELRILAFFAFSLASIYLLNNVLGLISLGIVYEVFGLSLIFYKLIRRFIFEQILKNIS